MLTGRPLGIVLVFALLVAGCGGGNERLSREEYEASVRDITIRAVSAIDVGPETRPQEIPERLKTAVQTLRDATSELESLNAPEEVLEPHDLLVEGIRELGDSAQALREDVQEIEDPLEIRATLDERRNLLNGVAKVAEAQRRFNQLGYRL